MTKLERVEQEVQGVSPEELAAFRRWFSAVDAEGWDRQFEADVEAEKPDPLAERALRDHAANKSTKL